MCFICSWQKMEVREQASEFLLRIERLMHPNLIGIAQAGKRCQALSSCIDCVGVLCTTF